MLNKLKIGMLVAAILMVLRVFLPDIKIPEGLQDAIMLIIIFVSQFFVKESEVTVSRLKFKKTAKSFASHIPAICLIFFLSNTAPVNAQGYDKERGREKKTEAVEAVEESETIRFQFETVAFGFGSFFDNEAITFSTDAMYGAVQWHGIGLPVIKEGTSTGLMLEGHVGTIYGQENFEYEMRVQDFTTIGYRLWSMTRVPISAVPIGMLQSGSVSRMYTGTDLLLVEGGEDYTGDFDVRLVFGGDMGIIGSGNLAFEIYSFQKDQPIAFAIFYGF